MQMMKSFKDQYSSQSVENLANLGNSKNFNYKVFDDTLYKIYNI